jgi:hypothetical protein
MEIGESKRANSAALSLFGGLGICWSVIVYVAPTFVLDLSPHLGGPTATSDALKFLPSHLLFQQAEFISGHLQDQGTVFGAYVLHLCCAQTMVLLVTVFPAVSTAARAHSGTAFFRAGELRIRFIASADIELRFLF